VQYSDNMSERESISHTTHDEHDEHDQTADDRNDGVHSLDDDRRRNQSISRQISSIISEAERNNPFLSGGDRESNFPSLDDFLQSGIQHQSHNSGFNNDHHVARIPDYSITSNDDISLASNANLSIGARASLNEHLRHVGRFGIDNSLDNTENDRNIVEPAVAYAQPTNPLDVVWNKLVETSVDFFDPSSHSGSDQQTPVDTGHGDELNIHDLSIISCSQSVQEAMNPPSFQYQKIIHKEDEDEECIEVLTDLSASDYFNSSRVQLLRTPPKNENRTQSVTVGRGADFKPFDFNEESLISHESDQGAVDRSNQQVATATGLPLSVVQSMSAINIGEPKAMEQTTSNNFGMWKNLDLSRISADGSDTDALKDDNTGMLREMEKNSFEYATDLDLLLPSTSFDDHSVNRNVAKCPPSVSSPQTENLKIQQRSSPSIPKYYSPARKSTTEWPVPIQSRRSPFIADIEGKARKNDERQRNTSNPLSAISQQAAESASRYLRQQQQQHLQRHGTETKYPTTKQQIQRTSATPLETEVASITQRFFDDNMLLNTSTGCDSEDSFYGKNIVPWPTSDDSFSIPHPTKKYDKIHATQPNNDNVDKFGEEKSSVNDLSPISISKGYAEAMHRQALTDPGWGTSSSSDNKSNNKKVETQPIVRGSQHGFGPIDEGQKQKCQTLPHIVQYYQGITYELDDEISPLHSSNSTKQVSSGQSKIYHVNSSLSSQSNDIVPQTSYDIDKANSFHLLPGYLQKTITNSSFERHTYPIIEEERRRQRRHRLRETKSIDNTIQSCPTVIEWSAKDPRRYRTVVPLRVFMVNTQHDFFPAPHDSFAAD
jgi:hypothetical protein